MWCKLGRQLFECCVQFLELGREGLRDEPFFLPGQDAAIHTQLKSWFEVTSCARSRWANSTTARC